MPETLPSWADTPTEELKATVSALIKDGCSAADIAAHFDGATRNAVISFCRRRKIQLKGRAPKPPAPPKKPKAAKPKVEARIDVRAVNAARSRAKDQADPFGFDDIGNDASHLLGIMDLKPHHCRWIAGDPLNVHGYCGKTAIDGSSYCSEHHARVYLVRS